MPCPCGAQAVFAGFVPGFRLTGWRLPLPYSVTG